MDMEDTYDDQWVGEPRVWGVGIAAEKALPGFHVSAVVGLWPV
jgi:hypothetical protein